MKKNKEKTKKQKHLSSPSALSRVWKVSLYFAVPGIIYNYIFWTKYGMDKAMESLDLLTMFEFSLDIFLTVFFFYMSIKYFFKLVNLIRAIIQMSSHDKEISSLGYTRIYEGVQGVGKTFNLVNDTFFQAVDNNRNLRLRYYLQYPYKQELLNDIDFKVLEDSYNYFNLNKDYIPNLMSNMKIWHEGKINYPFSMEYIDQQKRIAESFVLGVSEFANEFPNTLRTVKEGKEDVSNSNIKNETFSLARQMMDLTIIADEQRTGETFIGFRSVVSSNRYLLSRKKILRAKLLEKYLGILENIILKKELKTSKRLSNHFNKVAELVEDIGFYRFYYIDKEAIKDKLKEKEVFSFVVSCDFKVGYDSRGKRFDYKLYDKEPDYTYKKETKSILKF